MLWKIVEVESRHFLAHVVDGDSRGGRRPTLVDRVRHGFEAPPAPCAPGHFIRQSRRYSLWSSQLFSLIGDKTILFEPLDRLSEVNPFAMGSGGCSVSMCCRAAASGWGWYAAGPWFFFVAGRLGLNLLLSNRLKFIVGLLRAKAQICSPRV